MKQPTGMIITFLLQSVHSVSYNVAFSYKMTEEAAAGDGCIEHEERLGDIRDRALRTAGLVLAGNSQNWRPEHTGKREKTENAEHGNPDFDARRLPAGGSKGSWGCDKYCKSLCDATEQDFWCDCCNCCDVTHRRYLKAEADLDLEQIQIKAMLEAKEILKLEGLDVDCLAPSYEVSVQVELN